MAMLDPLSKPTIAPLAQAVTSAQAATEALRDAVAGQLDNIAARAGDAGMARILAAVQPIEGRSDSTAEVAAAVQTIIGMVQQLAPSVWPELPLPTIDPHGPAETPDAETIARAAVCVRDAARAIFVAVGSWFQTMSDLSAAHGWTALCGAGDLSREQGIISAVSFVWGSASSNPMPEIFAEPIPTGGGA